MGACYDLGKTYKISPSTSSQPGLGVFSELRTEVLNTNVRRTRRSKKMLEVYHRGRTCWHINIGGGVSIERILQVMRLDYVGAARNDERIQQLIKCGEGQTEFVKVGRQYIKPEFKGTYTYGDIVDNLLGYYKHSDLSYEVGLRWFITDSCGQMLDHGNRTIVCFQPNDPLVISGKPHALHFKDGLDCPEMWLRPYDLQAPFPREYDFLWAHKVGYGSPFVR